MYHLELGVHDSEFLYDLGCKLRTVVTLQDAGGTKHQEDIQQLICYFSSTFGSEWSEDTELGEVALVHHNPLVLRLRGCLHVYKVDLTAGVEVMADDGADDNTSGFGTLDLFLAGFAVGFEQFNAIPGDVGILGSKMLQHSVTTPMACGNVSSVYDIIHVFYVSIVDRRLILCCATFDETLNVTTLEDLISIKHKI